MAGFDEGEAEAMASNWVQNLRFRFARMGLNYHVDEVDNETVVNPERNSSKPDGKRVFNNGKCSTSAKTKQDTNDFNCKRDDTKCQCPGLFDQGGLDSTRSEISLVNLENLREKRLNFFQQSKSSNVSASKPLDNEQTLKTLNTGNFLAQNKSKITKRPENVFKENDKFENDQHYFHHEKVAEFDNYDQLASSNERNNKIDSDLRTIAWKSLKLNACDNYPVDSKILPKSKDNSSTLNDANCLERLNGKCDQYLSNSLSKSVRKIPEGFNGSVYDKEINGFAESKDALQVFPIEIDGEDYDMGIGNTQPEISLDLLDDISDSDSDFTLDDPVSRHTSPRVEGSPRWGHIRHNSGGMSPLAQSVSPPTPQITGALYHAFSSSGKDFDYEDSNYVANGNNNVKLSGGRHRPRSLSHPSTSRDCSELCGSSYLCCCANPNCDVVCDVSLTKQCVDVKVKYNGDESNNISNGWHNSSKNKMTNDYFHVNLLNKHFERVNISRDDLMDDFAKDSYLPPSKNINNIDEQYFDVCLCPECDEVNRVSLNWCSECGATLASTKPVSSQSINLHNKTNQTEKSSKIRVGSKLTEPSKANESKPPPLSKKSVSTSKADSDFQKQQSIKNKPRHNGHHWEKSNLAWSTFKDNHLSKPPSTKYFKTRPGKSSNTAESRPRSTSCRNPGNSRKAENSQHGPGSLPKSHKFQEFKRKKHGSLDHGGGNLALKGIKAKEMQTKHISHKSDSPEVCQEKPQPYLCLPDEIILKIFCYLSHADLARCSLTCQQLQRISEDEILWRTIVLTRHQNINDEVLAKIGAKKPVSLSMIKCHGKLVTSGGLRELFRRCAENLQELNFIGCNGGQLIGESILLHVGLRCNKLLSVDVSWSNVGDNGVEALVQNVERLECLCLNGCQAITDHSLKVVADKHGQSLRTFEIFGCFNVSAAAIKRLGQKCPNLETLNLGQCYKITSPDIGRLVSHLQSIVNLDLRGCKQARDACVKTIVKHCPHLVSLVLANCPLITDVAMSEIATNLSAVRCLDVCGCVKVTDHGVRALARSCNRLNSLDLSSTSITQKSVVLLANYCSQNLQSLKLSFCIDVTDDSVSRLVKHCKRMKTLHLYGCKRLRNVKALQELNQSLKLEF